MPQPFQKLHFRQLLRSRRPQSDSQNGGQPRNSPAPPLTTPENLEPQTGRTLLLAILNVTPDSFSDGGQAATPAPALARALQMAADGADAIDIGAESTRPGSQPVPAGVQLDRLLPVLRELKTRSFPLPLTIDTTSAEVADACLKVGGGVAAINDISAGLFDPEILAVTARHEAGFLAMHMQGTPATMQVAPHYDDVVAEVISHLQTRLAAARTAGIDPDLLIADPGIGFGKNLQHNLSLLQAIPHMKTLLNVPILIGTSRKGFLGALTGRKNPGERLAATAASVAFAAANGADLVRVHDVGEMSDVLKVTAALCRPPT